MRRVERWIFAPEDARRLAGVRIGLCLLLAYRLSAHDYDSFAARDFRFLPHSYMDVFAHLPSPDLASGLQALGIAAALAAALGLALRITLPAAFVSGLILDGMLNSAGRVMVRDVLLMLCLAIVVAAGRAAGEVWALRAPNRETFGERYGWPVRSAMVVIALAYFFAVPRLRWLLIPAVATMHVAIRIALGLDYSAQWLTVLIVFVDWPVVVDWIRRKLAPITPTGEIAR